MKKQIGIFLTSLALFAIIAFAALSTNSPSSCNGEWRNCGNAFGNNANFSTASVTGSDNRTGVWKSYGFSVPASASIDSVKIRADFWATRTSGRALVQVSGDNGATFGPPHAIGGTTSEQTYTIDVTSDLAWTPGKVGNLTVNVTCYKSGGGTNPTCRLDWLPVNVTYTIFDYSVSASPSSRTVTQGDATTYNVNVTLLGGVSQNVALSSSGCPTDAICTFNASSGSPTYASVLTVDTGASTPAGNYTIVINASGDGKSRITGVQLIVQDSQPVADASATPTSGFAPLDVDFTGSVTGGDAPFTYFWNFKDGTNSTSQNPSHTFNTNGTYNVTFKVTDNDGDTSTDNVVITVTADTNPVAGASADPSPRTAIYTLAVV